MISQETYKREKRRLATADGRFVRARRNVPPNPWSRESDPATLELAVTAARKLHAVAVEGLEIFEREGFPDTWSNWDRAQRDAAIFLQRWEGVAENG